MIVRFRHKGLEEFFAHGDQSGIPAQYVRKLRQILGYLNVSCRPADLDLPGFRLHPLKGDRQGQWAVPVTGNLRMVFEFKDENVTNVDLVDYH
jgi:proteic killer suppression protein